MTYTTTAESTETSIETSDGQLSTSLTAIRAVELVRALGNVLDEQNAEDSGTSQPRLYGYGLALVETTRVFREIKDGNLHLVDAISADEIDGVFAYLVDGVVVFPGNFPGQITEDDQQYYNGKQLDLGTVFSGRFSGTGLTGALDPNGTKIIERKGASGQTVVDTLVDETSAESTFVGTGIAYVYSKWIFVDGRFDGDPEIKCIVRLRKPVDPRGTAQRWSFNPYVQIYDFLTKSKDIGGLGLDTELIDTDSFVAGANWADMTLDAQAETKTALFTDESNDSQANFDLEFDQSVVPFSYGDVVQVVQASGQSVPPNFSTGVDYHVVPTRHRLNDFQLPGVGLAASLEDALDGNVIAAGTRTSDIDIKKVKEVRYVTGFTYTSNETPLSVLERMLTSCGAFTYIEDGKLAITQQSFPTTVETITQDQITGDKIAISNRRATAERATSLTGSYTALTNLLEPKDYPVVDDDGIYVTADNGNEKPSRLDLPLAGRATGAQRLATVALRRIRQERTITFSGLLDLWKLKPSTVFSLDFPELGLDSETTWEVQDQTLFVDTGNEADAPIIGVDITARELDSTVFDLDADSSQLVESAVVPGLDSPFEVESPGTIEVSESQFLTNNGAGVKSRVDLTWTAPDNGVVVAYIVSYKLSEDDDFIFLAQTPDLNLRINDLAAGTYDFNVVAVNSLNFQSEPSEKTDVVVEGLGAVPADPTGFEGSPYGALVVLKWDQAEDLDVRFGGSVEIYQHSDTAGGNSENARLLDTVDGNNTVATVAFVKGTYYIRFVDQSGNSSDFVEWSTEDIRPVPFGQSINAGVFETNDDTENNFTLQEDPTFPSTNTENTLFEDTDNQWLELQPASSWDDVTNVDEVDNVDDVGADGQVASEGVYYFSDDIELTEVNRVLLEAELTTQIVDESASIDVIDNVDDVEDWDAIGAGTAQPGQATAYVQVRVSREAVSADDFGPWQRLESRIFNQRSFQFRIVAFSYSDTVNIRISEARILARQQPVDA